ncbi:MAG: hypothetical protein ACYDA3_03495 [Gaiellaceae bacterium]
MGLLSVATIPLAIAVTHVAGVDVLQGAWAIPLGLALAVAALRLASAARQRTERTIGRVGGARAARVGRLLGGLGVYLGLTAALAIGIYELLNSLSG